MIPVMIVPILNRPDLLDKMLDSINYPIGKIVIIDNGNTLDPEYRGTHVIDIGHNLGVGASWNLGVKATALADWWLIANFDLEWGKGDLERLDKTVDPFSITIYKMLGYAAFALTPGAIQATGWFDENIHPAYNDDLDYDRRAELAGVSRVEVGFTGTHVGSATIHSDPWLRRQNGSTHSANDRYYARKWGGHKQGGETYSTPFNRADSVAEWTLDISRLRALSWRMEVPNERTPVEDRSRSEVR